MNIVDFVPIASKCSFIHIILIWLLILFCYCQHSVFGIYNLSFVTHSISDVERWNCFVAWNEIRWRHDKTLSKFDEKTRYSIFDVTWNWNAIHPAMLCQCTMFSLKLFWRKFICVLNKCVLGGFDMLYSSSLNS